MTTNGQPAGQLRRSPGVGDTVVIGLSSMIGAGIFAAQAPTARAAGAGLLIGLAAAGVLAYCNGFSSFAVLVYYATANAPAFTLRSQEGAPPRVIPVLGALGCVVVAFALPATSVIAGTAVLALGATVFWARRWRARDW